MRKYFLLVIIFIISFIVSVNDLDVFVVHIDTIIPTLFNILALALTAYTFVFSPLSSLYSKYFKKNIGDNIHSLLDSLEDNIKIIFLSLIVLIAMDIFAKLNIPFVKDPMVDFGIIKIVSFKLFLVKIIISFFSLLSIYSFYDMAKAMFVILRGILDIERSNYKND